MKTIVTCIVLFFTLTLSANNPIHEKSHKKTKVISKDCHGNITFSDTENELLEEIYFYNNNNKIVKSIEHIDENSDFEISDWKEIHHIIVITNKKTYRVNTQKTNI